MLLDHENYWEFFQFNVSQFSICNFFKNTHFTTRKYTWLFVSHAVFAISHFPLFSYRLWNETNLSDLLCFKTGNNFISSFLFLSLTVSNSINFVRNLNPEGLSSCSKKMSLWKADSRRTGVRRGSFGRTTTCRQAEGLLPATWALLKAHATSKCKIWWVFVLMSLGCVIEAANDLASRWTDERQFYSSFYDQRGEDIRQTISEKQKT